MNKFFLKSRTIWGILLMIAPQVMELMGFEWGTADTQQMVALGEGVATMAGALLALHGRLRIGDLRLLTKKD